MASLATIDEERDNRRVTSRNERHRALRTLWRLPYVQERLPSVYACHHHSILPGGGVEGWVTPTPEGPRAGLKGLATCGSVWVCPVCSAKIAARRADEIKTAVEKWTADGGRIAMLTLTRPHKRGDALDEMWFGNSAGWKNVIGSGAWDVDQALYGTPMTRVVTHGKRKGETVTENRIPWIRATEVTHGRNGWHPHLHVLLFLRGDVDLDVLADSMFGRWVNGLVRAGQPIPSHDNGFDARWIEPGAEAFGDYFAKHTYDPATAAGFEVAGGQQKKGRKSGRSPFQLLETVVQDYDTAETFPRIRMLRDYRTFREFAVASKGKRQIIWSRGLRDLLGLDPEATDEEIAAEDNLTDDSSRLAHYVNEEWSKIRRGIGEELHRLEREYVTDFLPTLTTFPEFIAQWDASWFEQKVSADTVGRIGVDRASTRRKPPPTEPPDRDATCARCGEFMAPEVRHFGAHLLCE